MRRLIAALFVIATLAPAAQADPCGGCWGFTTGSIVSPTPLPPLPAPFPAPSHAPVHAPLPALSY